MIGGRWYTFLQETLGLRLSNSKRPALKWQAAENVTLPVKNPLRSHFLRACGRRLTRTPPLSVFPCVSDAGRGPQYMPSCHMRCCLSAAFWVSYVSCTCCMIGEKHCNKKNAIKQMLASSLLAFLLNLTPQKLQNWSYLMFVDWDRAVCCWFGAACQEKKDILSISAFKYLRAAMFIWKANIYRTHLHAVRCRGSRLYTVVQENVSFP